MNFHWQHSLSARVGRRQFRWARSRARAGKVAGIAAGDGAGGNNLMITAPGLTDRSGGGSDASHDAATDTGRKPAPALTLTMNEEGRMKNEEVRCRTGNR